MSYWRRRIAERAGDDLALEVLDELAGHLAEAETSAAIGGASPDEARATAERILASASWLELAPRRRARHVPLLDRAPGLFRDVRLALRGLRRSPGFTATALLTLALGIGANTAIFTLVHAVLLESLPVTHANQLYKLGDEYRCCPTEAIQGNWSIFPYPFYREIRDTVDAFEELAAADTLRPDLSVRRATGSGGAEAFSGEFVSGNYFSTLGVAAAAGRLFDRSDDRAGAAPVVVASYDAWQRWGLDAAAIGAPLTLNGVTVTMAGVTPEGFFGDRLDARPPDFWLPMALEPTFTREESLVESPVASWVYVIGRLRRGAAPATVQARLTNALRNYLRVPGHVLRDDERNKIDAQVVRLVPGGGGINAIRGDYRQALVLLFAVSASVLLIACANLANLLLVRGAQARTATAVEIAIGAPRSRIVRRQLTETLLLALAGGAAGLLTAVAASRAIVTLTFRGIERVPIDTSPSLPVLLFAFAISLVTGLVFGVGPAWIAGRCDPADALRGSTRVVGDGGWSQRVLIVAQAAMTLVLVTVAALLSQSLRALDRQSYGFDVNGRIVVAIDPQSAGYTQTTVDTLYQRLDDRLSRTPGVVSESLSLYAPQQRESVWGARVFLEGGGDPVRALWNRTGPRYFETIGTSVVRGRAFTDHDTAAAPRVAIVNETFASQLFPHQDPIGHRFGKNALAHAHDYEIVGVVSDARYVEASNPVRPMFFVPLAQAVTYELALHNTIEGSSRYATSIELFVRGDPDAMTPAIRAAIADVDPNLAPKSMTTFRELIQIATSQRTLTARLSDAFGLVALLLAGIGLYGVTAYRAARRRNEIGLRMALGASRADIAALIVRGACSLTVAGITIGIPVALLAAGALRSQLFGVSPFDVRILSMSIALVVACALVASAVPARRAASIAPMDALRQEG